VSSQGDERREWVVVGRVRSARGVRGQLRVEVMSDSPGRFAPGQVVFIDGRAFRIERSVLFKEDRVLKLEGVDSREGAEALKGCILTVPAESLFPLPQGSYYHYHLVGMGVYTREGRFLGKLIEILSTGGNDVYVVRAGGKELLLPALDDVVLEVDVDNRRMMVEVPPGLEL